MTGWLANKTRKKKARLNALTIAQVRFANFPGRNRQRFFEARIENNIQLGYILWKIYCQGSEDVETNRCCFFLFFLLLTC